MTSLQRAIKTTAVAAATLIGVSLPAMADAITVTNFQQVFADGNNAASESLSSVAGAFLTGPDPFNTGNVGSNQLSDTANIFIQKGMTIGGTTVSFGTLNSALAQGGSFNLASLSNSSGPLPFWQIVLTDPNNSANKITLQGSAASGLGLDTLSASGTVFGTGVFGNITATTGTWEQFATQIDDGTALGNWNVFALGIGEEGNGIDNSGATAQINAWTVPTGAGVVAAVPEPSTWAMMFLGFAGLGLMSYRRNRRNGGLSFRVA